MTYTIQISSWPNEWINDSSYQTASLAFDALARHLLLGYCKIEVLNACYYSVKFGKHKKSFIYRIVDENGLAVSNPFREDVTRKYQ